MLGREFLRDVAVILAASFPVLFACKRLNQPQIVGFLVTGVAIGPHALGWLKDAGRVEGIAELGVVLILFFVGLQFPLEKLANLGKTALVAGSIQMALTTGLVLLGVLGFHTATGRSLGNPVGTGLFLGFLVSLSSTAVLLPLLQARDEMASPYARRFLGVALFQDLAVLPMVLLLPALAPASRSGPSALVVAGRVGLALVGITVLVAASRTVVPRILDGVARLGSRESFTGGVIMVVLAMIALAEAAGVSPALGAFAAGIVLGESEHVHEVAATLSPFRDLLSSLFFVSIGMLLPPRLLLEQPAEVLAAVLAVLLVKTSLAYGALRLAATTPRTALRTSLALATIGEFSFVLAQAAGPLGLVAEGTGHLFVAIAVVTLALAPLLVAAGPRLVARLSERVEEEAGADPRASELLKGHIVVVGYGLTGRSVCRALSETGVRHVVVELDLDRVAAARREAERVIRADATGIEGLLAAGVARALGVVVTIPDPDGARRAVRLCRQRSPRCRIVVRTRYVKEVEPLRKVGADEVIPEEFESSIEIVARVFRLLHVPGNIVAMQLRLLRDETYRRLRDETGRTADGRRVSALVAAGTTELFLVLPDTWAEGRALGDLQLPADHVAAPALLRDGKPFAPPSLEMQVEAGDTILLVGAHEDLAQAIARLETKR